MKNTYFYLILIFLCTGFSCAQSENPPFIELGDESKIYLEKVVDGIDIPWGISFIDEDEMLITDKKGILYHVKNNTKTPVRGLPKVVENRQGGLLDIEVDKDFKKNKRIFLTTSNSSSNSKESNTALYSANYNDFNISNLKLLYKATPDSDQYRHYGGKILLDDKYVYFTVGDRAGRDIYPQDLTKDGGKLYRLYLDGSIPQDNPFYNMKNAKKAIWSYGHRNPQGIIFGNEPGDIIVHEHGPRGGDEINIIRERDSIREEPLLTRNYGWPIVSNGINYNGTSFTDLTSLEGTETPSYFWTPSIAPSGMAMLTSDIYDEWKGNLFIGSLRFRYLERIELIGNYVYKREKLLDRVGRVREVVQGPDGFLYVGIEKKGVFKIIPSKVYIKNDIVE